MNKPELRQEIRRRKKLAADGELQRQSNVVCQRILSCEWWKASRIVLLYSALPDEVDVQLLIDDAMREGKQVLLPVVAGEILHLHPFYGETTIGAFGISEPVVKGERFVDYDKIDVAIIPGMAFDEHHHRLGRGKGFYDRLLSRCQNIMKVGVCFDFQYLETIPAEEHDVLMNAIVRG